MEQDIQNDQAVEPIVKLFVKWHNQEDPSAKDKMAYRFELWFDSLTSFYLGDSNEKQKTFNKACQNFNSNIKQIKRPKELIPFAYEILHKELPAELSDTNKQYSSTMLNQQEPKYLLEQVWSSLSEGDQNLLLEAYAKDTTDIDFYEVLVVRSRLKRALQKLGINFATIEDKPERDLVPLPIFEANKLQSKQEVQAFEYWLLNAPLVCRDMFEFAPFAHALRTGAIQEEKKVSIETPKEEKIVEKEISPIAEANQKEISSVETSQTTSSSSLLRPILAAIIVLIVLAALYVLMTS